MFVQDLSIIHEFLFYWGNYYLVWEFSNALALV